MFVVKEVWREAMAVLNYNSISKLNLLNSSKSMSRVPSEKWSSITCFEPFVWARVGTILAY